MKDLVFVTGNQAKADYLSKYLDFPVEHIKLELDEIQSLNLTDVVRHKVRQAYEKVGRPVLVEDVSLELKALGRLPGPLIKWFIEELSLDEICALVDGKDRGATARCVFGYFDGTREEYFEGNMSGNVPAKAVGAGGYGFDPVFIPNGYSVTRAELSEEDYRKTYLKIKPFEKVREFLLTNG
jgi:non-canonical purine NTP pyrophosphatase (RdgB/HAM1 family)